MKINKMTSYGIRVVARLCLEEGRITTSTQLSATEGIPPGVLMKVLSKLREAGIVQSHQGRGRISGGFSLCKQFDDINMKEVMEALEGEVAFYPTCEEGKYKGAYQDLYDRMKKLNEEYVIELSECKVRDLIHN